jgi:hypothetical protein
VCHKAITLGLQCACDRNPQRIQIFVMRTACGNADKIQYSCSEHNYHTSHIVCATSGTFVRKVSVRERGLSERPFGLLRASTAACFLGPSIRISQGASMSIFLECFVSVCVCVCVSVCV